MYKTLFIICMLAINTSAIAPAQAELEDPTRPPIGNSNKATATIAPVQQNKTSAWVLRSTLVSSQRRTAVINDYVVIPGDDINGATVVDIQQGQVQLRVKGKNITLSLAPKEVKTVIWQHSPQISKTAEE
ncbi:MAG: hypothetical protein GXP14_05005 [Gammaproteobacteria bacterium]|nr:hypothetical protein [Gammaproteobacteria bacterium]